MTDGHSVKFALVIPTLNEAGNIHAILDRVCICLSRIEVDWEILVVDDSSQDGTDTIVRGYAENQPRVRLVSRRGERGLSGAITHGWSQTDAELLGVMDADLQHPPELLPTLLREVLNVADLAIASRYIRPHSMDGWNPFRKLLSRLSVVASIPVQRKEIRVKDPLSGFFVVRRACIEEVQFQKTGFKLLLEILAKSRAQVVVEVPFQFGRRTADCSKADWRTGLDYAKLLIRLLKRKSEPGSAQVRSQKMEPRQTGQPPALQSILGLLPLVLGFQLIIWIAYLPTALRGRADFRNLYAAGLMIRQGMGHRLYDYDLQKKIENQHISEETALLPYVHLPYEALLFVALSLLSYQKAYVFWLGINLTVLFACFLLLRERLWRLKELWAWCPILFILGFAPITATLMQGQDSIITLLLLGCGLSAISSDKEYLAGLFVGLAAYKFQLVLPIAVLFLLWRRWKFCTGWLVSFVVAIVLSTLVCGWTQLFDYVFSLSRISNGVSSGNQILYIMPVERMPNLRGLIAAISHLRPSISFTVTVVTSAAFLVFAFWVGRNGSRETQFAIAVAAVPLIGFHVLMHDLSILLIPAALLIDGQDSKGFWIIPPIWLAPVLCFFALDYLAAIAVLTFFAVLLLQTRRNLNSPVQAISPIAVRL